MGKAKESSTIVIGKLADTQRAQIGEDTTKHLETVSKAEKELAQLPKLPKELDQKRLSSLQDSIINTQRKAIDSLLEVLKEKDSFLKEWEAWVTSIRECSESVREAEKLLRNVDNRRVGELVVALEASQKEVSVLKEEVGQLKQRVRLLLGQ